MPVTGKLVAILVESGFEDLELITSRKPDDVPAFTAAILDVVGG